MQNTDSTKITQKEQKDLFMATIVHDLKTPLIAQKRSLELLRNEYWGKLNDEQKEILDIVLESSNFMKEMLYSLLDIFKLENNFAKLTPETFNINQLTELCINEYKFLAASKSIYIIYKCNNKTKMIYADRNLIRRLITNLLDNSIKYGFKGTTVYISTEENENNIIFKIKNTGFKISNKEKSHIFDKFSSFSKLNHKPGTGLGLYYCQKVIEAHNGKIELCSENNINEFIVNIPIQYSGGNFVNFV